MCARQDLCDIPLLSVYQVASLVVFSSTSGTPRPVCSSTILIVKYSLD
jgi:hypothetical protein